MKSINALIFDVKLSPNGSVVLLETGNVFASKFDRYDRVFPKQTMRETVLKALAKIDVVYIEFKPTIAIANVHISDNIEDDVKSGKIKKGIIVIASGSNQDHDRVIQLRDFCIRNNKKDIIVLNAYTEIYAYNKLNFKEACKIANVNYPKTWVYSKQSLYGNCQELTQQPVEYYIIKPAFGSQAMGTTIAKKEDLKLVGKQLQSNIYDKEDRFSDFWSTQIIPLILQEFIAGKIVTINGKNYDPTIRLVIIASEQSDKSITIDFAEAFYDLPREEIKDNKRDSNNSISEPITSTIIGKSHLDCINIKSSEREIIFSSANLKQLQNLLTVMRDINPRQIWLTEMQAQLPRPLEEHSSLWFFVQQIERVNSTLFNDNELEQLKKLMLTDNEFLLGSLYLVLSYHYFKSPNDKIGVFQHNEQLYPFALQLLQKSPLHAQIIFQAGVNTLISHSNGTYILSKDTLQKMTYVVRYAYWKSCASGDTFSIADQAQINNLKKIGISLQLSDTQSLTANNSQVLFKATPGNIGAGPWKYFGHFAEQNLPLEEKATGKEEGASKLTI